VKQYGAGQRSSSTVPAGSVTRSRTRVMALAIALGASVLPVVHSATALAAVPGDEVRVTVAGSPLSSISTSPPPLSPVFSQTTRDYVVRCQPGVNELTFTFTATAGGSIQVGNRTGTTVAVPVNVVENEAVIVEAPDATNPTGPPALYWVRCLPHDFPQLAVTTTGSAPPGYYLTGTLNSSTDPPSTPYAMILDQNGTPVWYQSAPGAAINVQLLPNDTIAWAGNLGPGIGADPDGAFDLFQLGTQTASAVKAPLPPMDPHELLPVANGHFIAISSPLLSGVDLSSLGSSFVPANGTIVDCIVQEFDSTGALVWDWRMSDHVAVDEAKTTPMLAGIVSVNGQSAADIFHCNSVDVDPFNSNSLLISSRNTSAVYEVDKMTGRVAWKLGGTPSNNDDAQSLRLKNDPEGQISGQHDARFEPNGDVSLYDDHTGVSSAGGLPIAARGVEYSIDTRAGTATVDWSYSATNGQPAFATGGFRRYLSGADNLITWGFTSTKGSGFTEVDGEGNTLVRLTFPNGEFNYRTVKMPLDTVNINLLRKTAGLPRLASADIAWQPLGGISIDKPAVTSWGGGRLDAFVRGVDNQLWHAWNNGNGWSGWEPLGGILSSGPTVTSWGSDRLDVFVRGADDQLWHRWWDGQRWNDWEPLGGVLTSGPAVASWGFNRLDVFAQGTDNATWHQWWDGSGWRGWESRGGQSSSDPAASSWGTGRLDLFIRNPDGSLGHSWYDGGQWNDWEWFAGSLSTAPAAASAHVGQVDVAVSGAESVPLRFEFDGTWQYWQSLGGATTQPLAITALDATTEEVVVTGTDGQVWVGPLSP
jgi:hypothetical protein